MNSDIIGEWDVTFLEKGRETSVARMAFLIHDGRVLVRDADPEAATRPARVDVVGEAMRFEFLSAGSSRGNAHYVYEIRMSGTDGFEGTRRRGMLARTPIAGRRVERATLDEAEAAAVLADAEAEVAAALEAARRAAERAAAVRASVPTAGPAGQTAVAPAVLAVLPAPSAPPAFVPMAPVAQVPDAVPAAPGRHVLGVTHRLTYGDSAVLATEIHPGVFVWGGTFAAAEHRLREAGWQVTPFETGETIEVDELLIRHAAAIRDTLVG